MNGDRQRLRGHYDEDFYWERVDRNLGWLGDTTEEQRERQARLRDAVIGIVGTGGIAHSYAAAFQQNPHAELLARAGDGGEACRAAGDAT